MLLYELHIISLPSKCENEPVLKKKIYAVLFNFQSIKKSLTVILFFISRTLTDNSCSTALRKLLNLRLWTTTKNFNQQIMRQV